VEGKMGYPFDEESNENDYDTELDLQILREDLAAELLSINQYQEHIESLADEEAIRSLELIRDAKKEHAAKLLKLIQKLDTVQAEKLEKEI
jgi:rubrerythrin